MADPEGTIATLEDEARAAHRRLEALDAATMAIAQELSLDRVLQLIVDSVRPLAGARYAALGVPDESGRMRSFITSGIDQVTRHRIGEPPKGLGILGVIIHEGRTLRLDDLHADPRSIGFPANHPEMRSFLGVPVRVEGRPVGNLYLTEKEGGAVFDEADERLVESFARYAGLAIHYAGMHEDLRRVAVLEERQRIAQDLHDGTIQSLYAVSLSLEVAAESLEQHPDDVAARLEQAIDSLHSTIAGIREFILGPDPATGVTMTLPASLGALVDEFEANTSVTVRRTIDPDSVLPGEDARQVTQLAREALSNVARHAGASTVDLTLEQIEDGLRLTISDDGCGFEVTDDQQPGHQGLVNMTARARSLGGSLAIDSRPEAGTTVVFERHDATLAAHGVNAS